MAKNKKKSFSKVNVTRPILNISDNNEAVKLDQNKVLAEEDNTFQNTLTSDKFTETIKALETDENTKSVELLFNNEVCQKLKEHDYKISDEQPYILNDKCLTLVNQDNNKTSEDENLVIVNEIVETKVINEIDNNISIFKEKNNTIELNEIKDTNETKNISINEEKNNTIELIEIKDTNETKNISINEEKNNTIELNEIQIKNKETETIENKSTNCSRKFCSIL
jgi:hypothetical protein